MALLCGERLTNLEHDGLLVDDILDPDQEAQFHDVRKALRSVWCWWTCSRPAPTWWDRRDALAELVDAYGEVNDASIAYHDALESGHHEDDRKDDLMKAYKKARKLATRRPTTESYGRTSPASRRCSSSTSTRSIERTVQSGASSAAAVAACTAAAAGALPVWAAIEEDGDRTRHLDRPGGLPDERGHAGR